MMFLVPAVLILILLSIVMIRIWQTRIAMRAFAREHGLTYVNKQALFFNTGEIQGTVNGAKFFMGKLSADHAPEQDERDLSYRKYLSMHIAVDGMPFKMIIEMRGSASADYVIETKRNQTVTPAIKTGDADFDSRFLVFGQEKEVLPWLTPERRKALSVILSKGTCVVAKGGFMISMSETRQTVQGLEEVFTHLTEAQKGFETY